MAGGSGERFWPLSTKELPKQLLPLISNKTMIRETVERLIGFVDFEDIFIATNEVQYPNMKKEVSELPLDNFIIEPAFRDTAAAILYGSSYIASRHGENSTICVLASDHAIKDNTNFINSIKLAFQLAKSNNKIITLGIKPTYPETGYGYIKVKNSQLLTPNINVQFFEKPSKLKALKYFKSGKYLWNSGMFIFHYLSLRKQFEMYSPTHIRVINLIKPFFNRNTTSNLAKKVSNLFLEFPKISIDFAVMEKSKDVICIPVEFGWSDVGSFDSLYDFLKLHNKNSPYFSKVTEIDSNSSYIFSNDQDSNFYLIDINDIFIVKNGSNIMLVKKGSSHKIKELLKLINNK
jgi:mannose-1-phosphate guanylyltransferase